jgi:hypothetical protein
MPLLLAGAVAPALALMACASASAPPAGPVAPASRTSPASPRPALASAAGVIPGAARQVTLSMNYGSNADGRKPPAPVTVTSPARVGEVAGLVAGQPPWPPGAYSCPMSDGMALIATFRARAGGPALATAVLALNGCGGTGLTAGAKEYSLGRPDSARPLAARVLKAAGVPWKLPPSYWPPL